MSGQYQFVGETGFIGQFEPSRAQAFLDFDSRTNHGPGQFPKGTGFARNLVVFIRFHAA
jgi:hypothetical protein